MFKRPFASIEKKDIEQLILDKEREGKSLDFKQELPGDDGDARRNFLADVCAFANTAGGYLFYGIEEEKDAAGKNTGVPVAVRGLSINSEQERLKLEAVVRTGLDPRVMGIQMKTVDGFPDGSVLVLYVPRSYMSPHLISYRNSAKFYGRTSAGNFQLDVHEIRVAFSASEAIPRQVRDFRIERVGRIKAGETPLPIVKGPKFIIHLVPWRSRSGEATVSIGGTDVGLHPPGSASCNSRMNLDGLLVHNARESPTCTRYAQLFRSGAIEGVTTSAFNGRKIVANWIELNTIRWVQGQLELLAGLELIPPISVMLSLTDVRQFSIHGTDSFPDEHHYVDRDDLLLPDVVLQSTDQDPSTVMRPVFDTLWQSSGHLESPNYTAAGIYNVRGV